MSLALIPMIAGPAQLGAFETDWIPSVEDMDAAIVELQTKAQEFGTETFNNPITGDVDTGWMMAWNKFVSELADLKDGLWFSRWQHRSDILAMRKRFNDLVAWWHRIPGAVPTTNTPLFKPDQVSPPGSGIEETVKWAAIGVVAIAAIAGLAQLAPALKAVLPTKGGSR